MSIAINTHIPSDSSGFIEVQSIENHQKSTRRVGRGLCTLTHMAFSFAIVYARRY
ncbi:MAG: hypothetical protein LBF66_03080 [Holosporales bacterium]|nr:hypothetical protein [Holosporales bacterium]